MNGKKNYYNLIKYIKIKKLSLEEIPSLFLYSIAKEKRWLF